LALYITVAFGERTQPYGIDINMVQRAQGIDQFFAHASAYWLRQAAPNLDIAHHDTVKKMHDVKVALIHCRVLT
jgi:hypothetical protein